MSEAQEFVDLKTYDQAYPGRFLKAGLFNGKRRTLTIRRVFHDDMEGERGPERKVIMTFDETPLALVMCKLNASCIAGMFGKSIPAWYGKRVTFFATDTIMPMPKAKGDDRLCVRVYGSPDIAADVAHEFKMPRKRPLPIQLRAEGKAPAKPADPMASTQVVEMVRLDAPKAPDTCKVCAKAPTADGMVNGVCFPCAENAQAMAAFEATQATQGQLV